jgi:hypothetical protein
MEAAARVQPSIGHTYARRQPEKAALQQVFQQHLLTFEQQWTDAADGRTLPKFVLNELHGFMACGILGRGFAHLNGHEAENGGHGQGASCTPPRRSPTRLGTMGRVLALRGRRASALTGGDGYVWLGLSRPGVVARRL